jgi:hypothetical protein
MCRRKGERELGPQMTFFLHMEQQALWVELNYNTNFFYRGKSTLKLFVANTPIFFFVTYLFKNIGYVFFICVSLYKFQKKHIFYSLLFLFGKSYIHSPLSLLKYKNALQTPKKKIWKRQYQLPLHTI